MPATRDALTWAARLFRMWPAWVSSLILLVVIYHINPQQIGNTLFKAMVLTLGAVLGFWTHVWAYGHIDELPESMREAEKNRRCAMMVGGMLAFALAV